MGEDKNITFGVHLMIDGYNAPAEALRDRERLEHALAEIPPSLGMYNLIDPVVAEVGANNRKDPGGLSGVVLIAESHLSFHTFPGRGFVTIDLYTCQDELDTDALLTKLKESFQFTDEDVHVLNRGQRYPSADIH